MRKLIKKTETNKLQKNKNENYKDIQGLCFCGILKCFENDVFSFLEEKKYQIHHLVSHQTALILAHYPSIRIVTKT